MTKGRMTRAEVEEYFGVAVSELRWGQMAFESGAFDSLRTSIEYNLESRPKRGDKVELDIVIQGHIAQSFSTFVPAT